MVPLLDIKEVAHWLGITTAALRELQNDGKGPPFIRIAGMYRYRHSSVEQWLSDQEAEMQRAGESSA